MASYKGFFSALIVIFLLVENNKYTDHISAMFPNGEALVFLFYLSLNLGRWKRVVISIVVFVVIAIAIEPIIVIVFFWRLAREEAVLCRWMHTTSGEEEEEEEEERAVRRGGAGREDRKSRAPTRLVHIWFVRSYIYTVKPRNNGYERTKHDYPLLPKSVVANIQWNPAPRHLPVRQCPPIRHLL